MAMMNEMEYRTIGKAFAGGYRAAVYCRLSKDAVSYTHLDVYKRQHRLCTRGGMLESFLQEPERLTDDDVMLLLSLIHISTLRAISKQ